MSIRLHDITIADGVRNIIVNEIDGAYHAAMEHALINYARRGIQGHCVGNDSTWTKHTILWIVTCGSWNRTGVAAGQSQCYGMAAGHCLEVEGVGPSFVQSQCGKVSSIAGYRIGKSNILEYKGFTLSWKIIFCGC